MSRPWGWRVAVAIDAGLNVLFGGKSDLTISSQAAIARLKGRRWGCILCRFLDWLDKDHCTDSLHADLDRATKALQAIRDASPSDAL